jgi:hypothetical protein
MTRMTRRLTLAIALFWLVVGWAWLVRGAAHPGVPYRPWAFDHHAYSDLLAMAGDRYFQGGRPIPYLQDRVEYPVLLGVALWLPSLAPGGPAVYFTVGYALLAGCALACLALLERLPGARPWWLGATPALAYYAGLNWDLFPIALLLAALALLERSRLAASGAVVALGASAKLFPVALAPPAAAALLGRGAPRGLALAAAAGAGTFLAVNLPVALLAPGAWSWFWRFNAARGAENSIWEVMRHSARLAPLASDARFLGLASGALLAAAVAWASVACARAAAAERGPRALRLATAFILVAWIATNKVWSPQYALWACAAGALAAAPRWLFAVHAAVALLDYHVAFEARASRGLVHYFDAVYTAEEVLRFAAYAVLAAWIGRALAREARAGGAATALGRAAA